MKQITVIAAILFAGCIKPTATGHTCIWDLCPYKNLNTFNGQLSTDPEGSDGYILDSLHFVNPVLDYDQLEDLLFSNTGLKSQ